MPGCFTPVRFAYGFGHNRCARLSTCTQPTKETCPAVQAESDYIQRQAQITRNITELQERVQNAKKEVKHDGH